MGGKKDGKLSDFGIGEFLLFMLFLFGMVLRAKGVWLEIPKSGTKCVFEDIRKTVVVMADYYVFWDEDYLNTNYTPRVSVKVTSPFGNTVHHQENVTHGQFAFTTSEDGSYMLCFSTESSHEGGKGITVGIEWKTGIAAKDWESVAKKEHIEGLELELRKLEGAVEAIHENLIYLKNREADMREVSERTNGRVAWFSIMSLGVCVVVSLVQVVHLKHFFEKKKLI